jgi:glycosyltransferase involved in cell wall biosynthesis
MISFAITAHNEHKKENYRWLSECVLAVKKIKCISEIIIVDDDSESYEQLVSHVESFDDPRIQLFKNDDNLGVFGNKVSAIEHCTNDWVQLCDSDDRMDADHFDRLLELQPWDPQTMYASSWGKPTFKYQSLIGTYDAASYVELANKNDPWQPCQMNTGNHFVFRKRFVDLLQPYATWGIFSAYPHLFDYSTKYPMYWRQVFDGADSAFYNTHWLLSGGLIRVVDGLEYTHRYNATETGAYHSSPPEKEKLPPIYLAELKKHVEELSHAR